MNLKLCYAPGTTLSLAAPAFAQTFKLASPDKKTVVEIANDNRFQHTIPGNRLTISHPSSQKTIDHDKK